MHLEQNNRRLGYFESNIRLKDLIWNCPEEIQFWRMRIASVLSNFDHFIYPLSAAAGHRNCVLILVPLGVSVYIATYFLLECPFAQYGY